MTGELIEIASQVGGGGFAGVVLTYLAFRFKTRSELEKAYMSQLAKMGDRIDKLETRIDEDREKHANELAKERKDCDRRIAELRNEFEQKFDAITQPILIEDP